MDNALRNGLTGLWAWGLLAAAFAYPYPGTTRGPSRTFYFPDDPALNATTTRTQLLVGLKAQATTPVGVVIAERASLVVPQPESSGHGMVWQKNMSELRVAAERTMSSTLVEDRNRGPDVFELKGAFGVDKGPVKFPEMPVISEKRHWPGDEGGSLAKGDTSSTTPLSATGRPVTQPKEPNSNGVDVGNPFELPDCSAVDETNMKLYGICSVLNNYPEDLIQREIEEEYGKDASRLFFFDGKPVPLAGDEELPVFRAEEITETEEGLVPRFGIIPETPVTDTPMCAYDTKPLRVQAAKNTNNTWRVVVNDKRYVQTVHAEICRTPDESCDGLRDLPESVFGMETVCKQKYTSRRLLAIKKADEPAAKGSTELVTVMEYFRLPSCCVCYIRKRLDSPAKSGLTMR